MAEEPKELTEQAHGPRAQRSLYLVAAVCSLVIAFFGLNDEWVGFDEFLGVGPPWFSQLLGLVLVTFMVYGIMFFLTAILWTGITVGVLKKRPRAEEWLESLPEVVATVLLVLAILALFW